MFDLLIANGLIVDGTGNPGFYGAIGVEGETVRILRGDVGSVEARRVVDARSHVVSPGFIDMHAHSGLVILAEPHHEPKIRQGITTELVGIDGNSYAPFHSQEDFDRFYQLNSGLDGAPELPGRWSTVAEYLAMFDNKVAVNICYIVGNSPLRINAIGWENRPADDRSLANMKAMLREAMEEGAFGLSTGLDYPPGSYASTEELIALSGEAAKLGGIYHTHCRHTLGDASLDPFKEAIEIGRRSGIASHITHFYQRVASKHGAEELLSLVEDAREKEDLDVTFDSYPVVFSGTRLAIIFPEWVHEGGPERMLAAFRDPDARERLRKEVTPRAGSWQDMWVTYFKKPHNHVYEGRSIAELALMMGKHPVDAMMDLLLDEDLQTSYISLGGSVNTLPKFVAHPYSMVGSDAVLLGEYPSPRTYGCFPMILGHYVREEQFLRLPDAIRKMTSFPAQRLGLPDRGILRNGFKADVVVFDPKTVRSPATRANPRQFPVGIEYVIVNGKVVVDGGVQTDALAGRALRRGRPST
ncbi:MAG: D-aminoacylase [Chloroflexi bacterium]|nr:D-aminoacylase [Chloroflexota bacterium]